MCNVRRCKVSIPPTPLHFLSHVLSLFLSCVSLFLSFLFGGQEKGGAAAPVVVARLSKIAPTLKGKGLYTFVCVCVCVARALTKNHGRREGMRKGWQATPSASLSPIVVDFKPFEIHGDKFSRHFFKKNTRVLSLFIIIVVSHTLNNLFIH